MSSIIIGTVTAEDAAQRWGETGVDVISAGHLPPNPSELLSSRAMIDLLDHLKRTYDFVILDTPPLLAVTDAAILARRCGGAIMVVSNRGRRTVTRAQLMEAIENLESAGTKVLGVVLNRLPTKGPDAIALSEYGYMERPLPTPSPKKTKKDAPKAAPPVVDVGAPAAPRGPPRVAYLRSLSRRADRRGDQSSRSPCSAAQQPKRCRYAASSLPIRCVS